MLRVKLLSKPQETVARRISAAPAESPHSPPPKERIMLANVIKPTDSATLLPMASLKIIAAIRVVATPSKFNSKEAVAAGVLRSPKSKAIGARTPPKKMAPISHEKSDRESLASEGCCGWRAFITQRSKNAPKPLPK